MDPLDLNAVELPEDGLELERFRDGVALATLSTTSTLGTASCPSTAGSVMTAMCYGPS
ncbi:thiocillin family RiPP [Nonomuraea sp. NPDC050536]|uniref:thiocillin family RiPP n=1 Tax=Nonomuraea sp. NPDC050536 TaxID=3364366 RepID=UPI0037C8FECC